MKKWIVLFIAMALTGLIFWSCSEDSSTDPKPDAPVYVNEGVIGDIGGTVKIEDTSNPLNGAYVKIPEGALSTDETIKIFVDDSGLRLPGDSTAVFVKFEPEGLTFDEPIEIAIPFPEGSTPDNLQIYYYDPVNEEVHQIPVTEIDYEKGVVKGLAYHFSEYTAADGIKMQIETMNFNGKVGVRFNVSNFWDIPVPMLMGLYYLNVNWLFFTSNYYVYTPTYQVELYEDKGWASDPKLETRAYFFVTQPRNPTHEVAICQKYNNSSNVVYTKQWIKADQIKSWVDGTAIACKFDYSVDSSKKYYVKIKMTITERSDGSLTDRYTDIYYFNNKDKSMKIGNMTNYYRDKNGNHIDDYFDGYNPPVDAPPVCNLTSPSNNSSFAKGTKIQVSANATDENGISYVTFYADGEAIGGDTSYPYSCYYYTNYATIGSHTVDAVAVDKTGLYSSISRVTINITQPPNNSPTITITSPPVGVPFTVGSLISLKATASDTKIGIENVKFYIDDQLKTTIYNSPFEYVWNSKNYSAGNHTFKARATDDQGAVKDAAMTITLTKPNSAPVINSMTANPTTVYTGGTSAVTCSASDADGQTLYYSWSATGGYISGSVSGPSITWTAPATTGSYSISCTVSDGQDTDKESRTITVIETPPDPYITVATPNGGESWQMGTAYNITWTDNIDENVKIELFKGITLANTIIASTESDGTFPWAIPATLTAGTDYKVKITSTTSSSVLDESNAVFTINEEQTGNNPPSITSIIANPTSILVSGTSNLSCTATDLDGDALTYDWSCPSGSLVENGSTATWTAPATAGTYTITCSVNDGTDTVSDTVNITVNEDSGNNPPVIESIVPDSTNIYPNNSTLIVCNATDPDGDAIAYTWSSPDGTLSSTTGQSTTWTAPGTTGSCTITCTVSDGELTDTDTKSIYVTDGTIPTGMVLIPGGTFTMGDNLGDGYSDELPLHSVTLSDFYMGATEVTQAEWSAYMPAENWSSYGTGDTYPAYYVSWYEIIKYCNLRSIAEGLTPCYMISSSTDPAVWGAVPTDYNTAWDAAICNWSVNGYRLPSEAEWEYAARGGLSGQRFPNGATISHSTNGDTQANYYAYPTSYSYDVSPTTGYHPDYNGTASPVGSFPANGYGLYDMSGNLWEWCWDWYGSYTSDSVTNPYGPTTGSYRVVRGGGWYDHADGCRVAVRFSYYPDYSGYGLVGFRLSRTP